MNTLQIKQDSRVVEKFDTYPPAARQKLEALRGLILQTASEIDHIQSVTETLKWSEPSYLVKHGSTIRIDWKSKAPDQYAMYFICNTGLVETFRGRYGDLFAYEKNRALLFSFDDVLPETVLKECIEMALTYHLWKHKQTT